MKIEEIRKHVDKIDEEILKLLSRREELARRIGAIKRNLNLDVLDKKRENEILESIAHRAKQVGLGREFIVDLYKVIIKYSKYQQLKQANLKCNHKIDNKLK